MACCLIALFVVACSRENKEARPAVARFTQAQLAAQFSWDMGNDVIDVLEYPKAQQANYELFKAKCSPCHTLARPINSPFESRKDWARFVKRMHGKSGRGQDIDRESAQKIVEFLVYDAGVRKIARRQEFSAQAARLEALFAEARAEREKRNLREGKEKAHPFHYTGDRP